MNITYLLGAGASYNALPVVEQIPESLSLFANQFKIKSLEWLIENDQRSRISERYLLDITDSKEQKQKFEEISQFYKNIVWLKDESEKHTSIDTFAKKLYLKEDFPNLKKLKFLLSCFFIYLQRKDTGLDKRYDSFFASILDDINTLPGAIKILTWNYDSQLEIAFKNFSDYPLDVCKSILKCQSKSLSNRYKDLDPGSFGIYKINGTTDVNFGRNNEKPFITDLDINDNKLIEKFLFGNNSLESNNLDFTLSFAWENHNDSFFNKISNSIQNTEVLVIIGYSFPFFNRKVDEFILNSMPNLKKIYVQDPYHADDIIEKIKGLKTWKKTFYYKGSSGPEVSTKEVIDFIPKTFKDQFFIPIEF
ncbi:MAG: hypothetical protein AAFX55_12660 [Bacteroidota bacterium]